MTTAPISTTSITGLPSRCTRVQLPERVEGRLADDVAAEDRDPGLALSRDCGWSLRCHVCSAFAAIQRRVPRTAAPAFTRKCSTIGPSASAGKNVSPPTMNTTPDQQADEERPVGRQRAGAHRHHLLLRQRAGQRQDRDHRQEAREQHLDAHRGVVERRVGRQAGEGRAVVGAAGREGVEDLASSRAARRSAARPGPASVVRADRP